MRFFVLVLVGLFLGCGDRETPVSPVAPSGKELSVESVQGLESVQAPAGKSVAVSARYVNAVFAVARSGNLGIMQLLVRLGATVDATDDEGNTALHLAAGAGHLDVVEYLVEELELDVAATNDGGATALDLAAAEGHREVVAYLESVAAEEVARTPEEARAELDSLGIAYTADAFIDSAVAGNLEAVQLFVQSGMEIDAANIFGGNALHGAVGRGHLEMVKYLVEQGASLTTTTHRRTALNVAAFWGHLEMVKYLVEQGASLTATNYYGYTAKDLASGNGHTEVVAYLESVGG